MAGDGARVVGFGKAIKSRLGKEHCLQQKIKDSPCFGFSRQIFYFTNSNRSLSYSNSLDTSPRAVGYRNFHGPNSTMFTMPQESDSPQKFLWQLTQNNAVCLSLSWLWCLLFARQKPRGTGSVFHHLVNPDVQTNWKKAMPSVRRIFDS